MVKDFPDDFWAAIKALASEHNEKITDKQKKAWSTHFFEGKTPQEVFYDRFPEHA